jgi:hypothetical protein
MQIQRIKIYKHNLYIAIYFFFAFLFLLFIGIDAVEGKIDFEFYADSETYLENVQTNDSISDLLEKNPNLLGPSLILKLFNSSYFLVFLLHYLIVFYFVNSLYKLYAIKIKMLFLFLLISPIFFSSVLTINKEIISVLVITFLINYFKNRSIFLLIFAILVSFLVRWQMALFVSSAIIILNNINFLKRNKIVTLTFFLIGVSIIYSLNQSSFENINRIAEIGQEGSTEGSGFFSVLIEIQNSGPFGYFIVFLPKTLFLLLGSIARYYNFFDFTNLYNNVFVFSQSVVNAIIIFMLIKNRVSMNNIFLFLGITYCIIFSLSPIFSPRYFFPAYIYFVLALSSTSSPINLITIRHINEKK